MWHNTARTARMTLAGGRFREQCPCDGADDRVELRADRGLQMTVHHPDRRLESHAQQKLNRHIQGHAPDPTSRLAVRDNPPEQGPNSTLLGYPNGQVMLTEQQKPQQHRSLVGEFQKRLDHRVKLENDVALAVSDSGKAVDETHIVLFVDRAGEVVSIAPITVQQSGRDVGSVGNVLNRRGVKPLAGHNV